METHKEMHQPTETRIAPTGHRPDGQGPEASGTPGVGFTDADAPPLPPQPETPAEWAEWERMAAPNRGLTLGRLVATPGALEALADAGVSPTRLLARHVRGDWGELDEEDRRANDRALLEGTRLLSAYTLPRTNEKVWVITEWDRSSTTILLPSEY